MPRRPPDGRREDHAIRTRLLMPHELCRLLETSGFVDVELVTMPDGSPLELDSRRCVALARRG
ncbi:MAG: hypothetical protein R3288_14945 [Woeseiaceae bacterium]|nr:hypothetical protein [Woeseiaceae bacterium]